MKTDLFQVVILAGGLATRLRPMTEAIPKSLIDVNGEPFIVHQLRLLQQQGIQDVLLCIGFLGEQIIKVIGDGSAYGLNIVYSSDGPTLLGTAGSIKRAMPLLKDTFFVLYGDSYLPCHYKTIQTAFDHQKLALMTVYRNFGQWDTSNVEFVDGQLIAYDKKNRTEQMHFIDYGLGIFNKTAFNQVPDNECYDLALLYQNLLIQNQLAAFEVSERFYEIGSLSGIQDFKNYLQKEYHAIY